MVLPTNEKDPFYEEKKILDFINVSPPFLVHPSRLSWNMREDTESNFGTRGERKERRYSFL